MIEFIKIVLFLVASALQFPFREEEAWHCECGYDLSYLNKKSIKDSVIYGSAAAAIVVTRVGCSPAMPDYEELELFVKENTITKFKES